MTGRRSPTVGLFLPLRDRLGSALIDAAVVTTGTEAYRNPQGIAVIPAGLLGP